MFSERTRGAGSRIEIRTIDSIIAHIASAYHAGLGLPADIAAWVRQREEGYADLALKVAALLKRHPMIAASLAQRYSVVICDEHQDSSGDQYSVVMALLEQGARLRVFADPMQKIFKDRAWMRAVLPATGTRFQLRLRRLRSWTFRIDGRRVVRIWGNGLSRRARL